MTLNTALANAFSGLRANTRAATLISTNIANATTESYARRTLDLSSGPAGTAGGVRVNGVLRNVDPVIVADRRASDAAYANGNTLLAFANRFEKEVGIGSAPGSLVDRATRFETALLNAAANSSSTPRLETVVEAAQALATKLNRLSDGLQSARQDADRTIGTQVASLNEAMRRLEKINDAMKMATQSGADTSALQDERARLLDTVSEFVPLRVVERPRGEIAVFTRNGAPLLDVSASKIDFQTSALITPSMTAGAGLSGLLLNGQPVDTSSNGLFSGGSIAANFRIRDTHAVLEQEKLDGLASELLTRMDQLAADTTIGADQAGLFRDSAGNTVAGTFAAYDPTNEVGIAGRIMVHAEQVNSGNGTSWRIRDGIYATTQGDVGSGTLISALRTALSTIKPPESAVLGSVGKSFSGLIADYSSSVTSSRVGAENESAFLNAQNTTLKEIELTEGVDTDLEIQNLMQVEQLYAANARVMSTVDSLMERLLSI